MRKSEARTLQLTRAALLLLAASHAPELLAGSSAPAEFLTPLQNAIDWLTGPIGRALSVLALGLLGVNFFKARNEGKGGMALTWLLGSAILLGAAEIADSLGFGFSGAVY